MTKEDKILAILEKMQEDMAELKADVAALKTDMANVQEEIADVKTHILDMEQDIGPKLNVLFDAYQLNYEISKNIRADIASLFTTSENNDVHIKWLRANMKHTG